MYPIIFENIYFEKVWGGRAMESFRTNLPEGNIGESWDIACHENGMSVVKNGVFKGQRLDCLIENHKSQLLGTKIDSKKFPLLVKVITARENLSVQVHPNDDYAKKVENSFGKTEAWYVLDATEDASLIVGIKGDVGVKEFKKSIKENSVEDDLNKIAVKKGDCFLIESGLVHAICGGCTLVEIQQNSDITYRVYDYGRDRELHIDKSLDVINFELQAKNSKGHLIKENNNFKSFKLIECDYFEIDKYEVKSGIKSESNPERFEILTIVEGEGFIDYLGKVYSIKKGDSVLIAAEMGEYGILGEISYLKSYAF